MKWIVRPSKLNGTLEVPPSKSHTIRALLISALANGTSTIRKPLLTGDGGSAVKAARALGAYVESKDSQLTVDGIAGDFNGGDELFDMGNSGTGTTLFASAAALGHKLRRFDGDNSLRSRPIKPLLESLANLGASYTIESENQELPFTIQGPLKGGKTVVDGISSQFVSSLLLACPLIKNNTHLTVSNIHEQPYIEITLWWLRKLGIEFEHSQNLTSFIITGGQQYEPVDITVPADFSSATFAAVAGVVTNGELKLTGLDFSDPQGDKDVFKVLTEMGADVRIEQQVAVSNSRELKGMFVDLNSMPDALPALSVAACKASGETLLGNVEQARIKETDRIAVMCSELSKMGASVREHPDGLVIQHSTLKGAHVSGHDDHRVVMALALAGMNAEGETVIDSAEAAAVTYPTFVEDFKALGADIQILES
ncbi:3-phosphoshikimate 1-carboxyvinyltransferase [Chitinispirillales bacterium ANBcel5]|uniref:3-phosphoshikimate 1-carboxyvinyltransferase n=1 Tax=Cellulosispirillum alkaliphilum TaxID=3039283 RepID=UPI002A5981C4|nr:3-phosphoshikimate 1-carboxyvinyltransferase [Chitinispirillales bacterium ANBcel5]